MKLHRSDLGTPYDPPSPLGSAVDRLCTLLQEENTALKEMDFGRAGALLQAKYAAAGVLEAALRADRPGVLTGDTKQRLAGLAAENRALLQRAARIQKRVATLVTRVLEMKEA